MRTRLKSYLAATTIVDVLPIKLVSPSRIPMREDVGDLHELAKSIKQKGLLEPVIVRPVGSRFELVAGHRRYVACRMNGFSEILAIVTDFDDREAFEVSLEENIHRKTMDPIEEATAFKLYIERMGYGSETELAARIGKSQEYVSHRIKLLTLGPAIQEAVRRRRITTSEAIELARLEPGRQMEVFEATRGHDMTIRELRKTVTSLKEADRSGTEPGGFLGTPARPGRKNVVAGKVERAASVVLKAAMIKIDGLLDNVDSDEELRMMLIHARQSIHDAIGELGQDGRDVESAHEVENFIRGRFLRYFNARSERRISRVRVKNRFTVFDDFPPLDLMDYERASVHDAKIFGTMEKSRCRIYDLHVSLVGPVAVATFLFNYDTKVRGFTYRWVSRVTMVLERVKRDWRILHEHWSQGDPVHSSFDKLKRLSNMAMENPASDQNLPRQMHISR
jgi:ParB family chromosome partitioning protein